MWPLKRPGVLCKIYTNEKIDDCLMKSLAAKTIEGSALSLESIDNIHSSDSLSLSVFGVCDRISDDVLEEDL